VYDDPPPVEQCTAELLALGLGDGLPVVPPTRARIDRMLAGVEGPATPQGQVPPLRGALTPEAIAYQAVLAGCEPGWLDVVFAAVRACAEPRFNALGLLTTTGTACVAVILSPAAAEAVGANAGANCLGPGNRANASIGRAVALSLVGLGGALPGLVDMATMGQPGKYTLCFAEAAGEPGSLLPPLHERRGLAPGARAVTVVGVSGTAEVVAAWTSSPQAVVETIAGSLPTLGTFAPSARRVGGGEQFVLVPPEVATILGAEGWTLERVQRAIYDLAAVPAARLPAAFRRETLEQNWGTEASAGDGAIAIADAPDDVVLVLTGGIGGKVTSLPTWMGGTRSVTAEILPLR
jgi:hypothetical protein